MKSLEQLRQSLSEEKNFGKRVYSSDTKINPNGRVVHARLIKVGDRAPDSIGIQAPDVITASNVDRTDSIVADYEKQMKKLQKAAGVTPSVQESVIDEIPPFVLVLKRKNIRMFNGNVKIALYHCEKINKYFSVPFGNDVHNGGIQAEETSKEQELLSNVLDIFVNLSEENKVKMLEMVNGDNESFNKLKLFTDKYINESN
jgi:hypothetical protein